MSEYFKGEGGSQIPMLQIIRRQKLDKSGSKFRHGGGGVSKTAQKILTSFMDGPYDVRCFWAFLTYLYLPKSDTLPHNPGVPVGMWT